MKQSSATKRTPISTTFAKMNTQTALPIRFWTVMPTTSQNSSPAIPPNASEVGVDRRPIIGKCYRDVFGAQVVSRTEMGGMTIHAQLNFGNGYLHLEAPNPDGGGLSVAQDDGPDQFAFAHYCSDIHAVVKNARRPRRQGQFTCDFVSFRRPIHRLG